MRAAAQVLEDRASLLYEALKTFRDARFWDGQMWIVPDKTVKAIHDALKAVELAPCGACSSWPISGSMGRK